MKEVFKKSKMLYFLGGCKVPSLYKGGSVRNDRDRNTPSSQYRHSVLDTESQSLSKGDVPAIADLASLVRNDGKTLPRPTGEGWGEGATFAQQTEKNLFTYLPIHLFTSKKAAFTLAEVLITLGIIGVVAAMTMPMLIANHQKKQTVTKLQKSISILNQASRLAYYDVGEPSDAERWAMETEEYFNTYWAPYLKVETCTDYKMCGYNSNTPFKYINGTKASYLEVIDYEGYNTTFYTLDGFLYIISRCPQDAGGDERQGLKGNSILVDINGGKGPNTFGKDVFLLYRLTSEGKVGTVVTSGHGATTNQINNSCSKTGDGTLCAEKILRASWQIKDDYPW